MVWSTRKKKLFLCTNILITLFTCGTYKIFFLLFKKNFSMKGFRLVKNEIDPQALVKVTSTFTSKALVESSVTTQSC